MIVRYFYCVILFFSLFACYNSGNDSLTYSDSKDIKKYYKEAKEETDPIKAYKDALAELKIMHQNKTDVKTISYDSCITDALSKKIDYLKNAIEFNVIDYRYLDYLVADSVSSVDDFVFWNFMHSQNFNMLFRQEDIGDHNGLASLSLAHLNKIIDNRFTIVLHKQAQLLPRTNKPNYVLGGFFEGYGLLYDLKTQQVLCYFSYRINNTSNYREDYSKDEKPVFDNMMLELEKTHHSKLRDIVAEKLNLESFQVYLGFDD